MTDTTPAVATMLTTVDTGGVPVAVPLQQLSVSALSQAAVPVTWYTPTSSRWVAYRGVTRIGSIDHVGAFITTNQHMDVLGAFVELAEAQLAIADPQPADADMVRRTRAQWLRRKALLRRAAIISIGAVLAMLIIGTVVLLAAVR